MDQFDQMGSLPKKVSPGARKGVWLPFVLRFALRDFRGGLRGFAVFLASIALGVAAITGVGSVSLSLKNGLEKEGRAILGGDVSFDIAQRELAPAERDFLGRQGRVTVVAQLRAMARTFGSEASLIEIKAVDDAYPLSKAPQLDPALPLNEVLDERNGAFGIAPDTALLA